MNEQRTAVLAALNGALTAIASLGDGVFTREQIAELLKQRIREIAVRT